MGKPLPPIMGDSKKSTPPTSPPSSPAPAANGSSGMKIPSVSPGLLLSLSGGWLLARMFLFGGALWPIEAISILVADGFAYNQGNKGQKKLALLIMAIAGINLFFPGFNQGVKNVRETQLNPPGEMAPIEIISDGEYDLPDRPLKVCITMTGDPATNTYLKQEIIIKGIWKHIQVGTDCIPLPKSVEGKRVNISLGTHGKEWSPQLKEKVKREKGYAGIRDNFQYYFKTGLGVGAYPTIQTR